MTMQRRLLLLLAGATAVLLGCRDNSILEAPPPAPRASLLGSVVQPTGLLSCSPLPSDSVTQTVGPDGGTILVGSYSLAIPAGAPEPAPRVLATKVKARLEAAGKNAPATADTPGTPSSGCTRPT